MDKLLEKMKTLLEKAKTLFMNMKHKKLILGISAGVLVLAISLVILLSGMQGAPLTPAQQYIKLETDLLHGLINSIPNEPAEGAAVTNIDILPTDALLAMFGMEDMDWVKKLTVTLDAKQKDDLQEVLWGFKLNDKELFTANMISDPIAGITYLTVPIVSDLYLKVDESIAGELEGGNDIVGSASGLTDFLAALNISEMDVAKALLNKYIDLFFSHMTDVEKQTQVLNIGGKTQTAEVYTNYITEKVFTDALRAVLTEAKNDAALKAALPEDMDLEDMIDGILDTFTDEPSTDRKDAIVLKLYVDSENSIIGRDLLMESTEISILTATQNDSTAFKATYGNEDLSYELMVDGSGKGTLSMVQPDQSVILASLTYALNENTGVCEITLSDFIENLLFQSTDMDPTLKITWDLSNGYPNNFGFALHLASEHLITIQTATSSKEGPHDDIIPPSSALDMNVEEEMNRYMDVADMSVLRANMLDAGVPKKFVDFVLGKE